MFVECFCPCHSALIVPCREPGASETPTRAVRHDPCPQGDASTVLYRRPTHTVVNCQARTSTTAEVEAKFMIIRGSDYLSMN